MLWGYPGEDVDPWYDSFESMVIAMDSSGYASREDRNIIFGGGGDVSWDAGTDTLTWTDDIVLYSMISGFKLSIPSGFMTVLDGEVLYVDVTRSPLVNATLVAVASGSVPNTDSAMALAVRVGDTIYWRWGSKIETGETLNLFGVPGSGGASDIYERAAIFSVPIGASSDDTTLGRIAVQGSLIGLSAEIDLPVTAGTVTVNAKVNGVTKLTVVLSTTDPSVKQTVVSPVLYPVMSADQVSVEVVGVGYNNTGSLTSGLTVNVVLVAGLQVPLANVPDASTGTKGVTRLSVAPAVSTSPIAAGDNDPRLVVNRRIVYTIVQPADGSNFNVPVSPVMPTSSYIVTYSLGTVVSHVTLNIPTAGRLNTQFNVITNAALLNGETIYFHVVEI
jgi:hypothetical protein